MLTAARAREVLDYDPTTGRFLWKKATGKMRAGAFAGRQRPDGYRRIGIDGKRYLAHRVAWLWMTGEWPSQVIDHISNDPGDNRWCNLRDVSKSANGHNLRPDRRNGSGYRNVWLCKKTGKWATTIIARFETPEQAEAAGIAMREALFRHL